jgi:hypothetical protein
MTGIPGNIYREGCERTDNISMGLMLSVLKGMLSVLYRTDVTGSEGMLSVLDRTNITSTELMLSVLYRTTVISTERTGYALT